MKVGGRDKMKDQARSISAFSIAFILIGALFGAAFASGQEIMKFFCAYGEWGKAGFAACLVLYLIFGYMVYELGNLRNSGNLEEIVSPADNKFIKKAIYFIMMFCFFVILVALFAAGDALFTAQLNFPKGVGGGIITILVIITNIVGFSGIKRIMPLIVPVMLVVMLAICIGIIAATDHTAPLNPEKYMSPLAPNWFIGALLYLSYNFLATIPALCTLPRGGNEKKKAIHGMLIGFTATCFFGFLLYSAVMTDIDIAGGYDIPMIYLSAKLSPAISVIYSLIMVIAIYSASSNCLYGLTKETGNFSRKKRTLTIVIIGLVGYFVSLVGFSQIVTYAYPIQGYACILVMLCVLITYIKYRKKAASKAQN